MSVIMLHFNLNIYLNKIFEQLESNYYNLLMNAYVNNDNGIILKQMHVIFNIRIPVGYIELHYNRSSICYLCLYITLSIYGSVIIIT